MLNILYVRVCVFSQQICVKGGGSRPYPSCMWKHDEDDMTHLTCEDVICIRFWSRFWIREDALHGKASTHRSFYTGAFIRRCLYTQKITEAFTHRKLLHREAFMQRSLHTQISLHSEGFTHRKFLHTGAFTLNCFYTKVSSHTNGCTQRSLYQ